MLFVHLYLADMSHFAAANGAYRRHFPAVSPAARACVEVPLPPACPVMLEVLLPSTVEGDYHGQLHAKSSILELEMLLPSTVEGKHCGQLHAVSLILTCYQVLQIILHRDGLTQKPVLPWQTYTPQSYSSCYSCSSFAVAVSKAKAGIDA